MRPIEHGGGGGDGRRFRTTRRLLWGFAIALATQSSCGEAPTEPPGSGTPPGPPRVTQVQVTLQRADIRTGETIAATAQTLGANGQAITGRTVTWSSSVTRVATIAADGAITAADTGTTTITATVDSVSGTATLVVRLLPVTTISLSSDSAELLAGDSLALQVTLRDSANRPMTGRPVTWTSDAAHIATVGSTGRVRAVAPGVTFVNAASEGRSARAKVVVRIRAEAPVTPTTGGTLGSTSAGAQVQVPAGAVSTNVTLTVAAVTTPPVADPTVVPGTTYTFGPEGIVFAQPVTMTLAFAPAALPAGVPRSELGLHKLVNGEWVAVTRSRVDSVANTVSGDVPGFSTWSVRRLATASIATSHSAANVRAGEELTIGAVALSSAGDTLRGRAPSWTSGDTTVVTVTAAGRLQGRRAGTATLTVTIDGVRRTVQVTVVAGAPATITPTSTTVPSGTVAANLATVPSVVVRDAFGNVVPGIVVNFAPETASDGTVTGGVDTTDASGIAAPSSWRLGTVAGTQRLAVTLPGYTTTGTLTATATPLPPATITLLDGDAQTAAVGTATPAPLRVIVQDRYGNPVSGAPVAFSYTAPGGSAVQVVNRIATTGTDGIASLAGWTLLNVTGAHTMSATYGTSLPPVTFTATATEAVAVNHWLVIHAGNGQTAPAGSLLPVAPAVKVTANGATGAPVAGVEIVFASTAPAGSAVGAYIARATTNAEGIASAPAWRLPSTPGTHVLTASVPGGFAVAFTATATAPTTGPAAMTIVTGDGQVADAGALVPVAPSVRVVDAAGMPVAGVSVSFSSVAPGGSSLGVQLGQATTNADGIATVAGWRLGTTPGTNTLVASVAGIESVSFTATGRSTAAPASLEIAAGDAQTATAGTAVAVAPAVLVKDAQGNPLAGVSVAFSAVPPGSGAVAVQLGAATTDANGVARLAQWTLGTTPGTNTLTASVGALAPVTFTATGTAP